MDLQTRLTIQAECAQLFYTYGNALDDADGPAAAACFTVDGEWDRQGNVRRGRAAIQAAIEARPRNRVTRHVFTNLNITVLDADHATGRAYYLVFRHDGPGADGGPLPRPMVAPERLGDYLSWFVRTAEGWRLQRVAPKRFFDS